MRRRAFGLVLLAVLLGGCAGPGGSGSPRQVSEVNRELARGSLAAVEIRGQDRITVMDTVESVFVGAGLKLASKTDDTRVFERSATSGERFAYGTWSGGDLVVRLRVECLQQGSVVFLLRCFSFLARDAGTMVEDEQRLDRSQVREYRGLLHEVSQRLN